jgi:microcystin-dependent protein
MGTPYMGEIKLLSFTFPPRGWAPCNGQLMQINQNQALFSLLGTTYGGNGQTNFALPDLRGRVAVHRGPNNTLGWRAGEEFHRLTSQEMPVHGHFLMANPGQPAQQNPQNPSPTRRLASSQPGNLWGPATSLQPMHPQAVGTTGGTQPHENRQPYLVLSYCIALIGIFPTPN